MARRDSAYDFTVIKSPQAMHDYARERKLRERIMVLVPTMGALHDGHLSLLRLAEASGDEVIVSIYVNPTQFGLNEDFDHYPRRLKADLQALSALSDSGVRISAVYVPPNNSMYRTGFNSEIRVPSLSQHLCGRFRPDYFSGVALVVAKLLHQTLADKAVFGEKDYQQLAVIRRMIADLDFGVEILAAPTMRSSDGLALSSRNTYLTDEERQTAPLLYDVLCDCGRLIMSGEDVRRVLQRGKRRLLQGGFERVDYINLVNGSDLRILEEYIRGSDLRLLAAAYLGRARLIDNIKLDKSL